MQHGTLNFFSRVIPFKKNELLPDIAYRHAWVVCRTDSEILNSICYRYRQVSCRIERLQNVPAVQGCDTASGNKNEKQKKQQLLSYLSNQMSTVALRSCLKFDMHAFLDDAVCPVLAPELYLCKCAL